MGYIRVEYRGASSDELWITTHLCPSSSGSKILYIWMKKNNKTVSDPAPVANRRCPHSSPINLRPQLPALKVSLWSYYHIHLEIDWSYRNSPINAFLSVDGHRTTAPSSSNSCNFNTICKTSIHDVLTLSCLVWTLYAGVASICPGTGSYKGMRYAFKILNTWS